MKLEVVHFDMINIFIWQKIDSITSIITRSVKSCVGPPGASTDMTAKKPLFNLKKKNETYNHTLNQQKKSKSPTKVTRTHP